jgi:nicotinamidase/pyrazinamidase
MAGSDRPVTALIVVDVQRDFCDGGVLPARSTANLIPDLNAVIALCSDASFPIAFTRDWHPPDHSSFLPEGGRWPVHCVRETNGAEFASALHVGACPTIIDKGVDRHDPGYSAFAATDLANLLNASGVTEVAICGIATEYCVLESVRGAVRLGFRTCLLEDLIRPIDARPGDGERAMREIRALGAEVSPWRPWWTTVVR